MQWRSWQGAVAFAVIAGLTGLVEIGPRYSVNSELRRFSARDPGQPLDGIGQYLYPKRFDTSVLPKN